MNKKEKLNPIIVYTFRYIWKENMEENTPISVKIVTGTMEEHEKIVENINKDNGIESCVREYVNEYDLTKLAYVENVKVKEEKNIEN